MIKKYVKSVVTDFWRYMDTSVPRGVDTQKYIRLKYTNNEQVEKFIEEHDLFDRMLLEKVAIHDFMSLPEEEIVNRMMKYM